MDSQIIQVNNIKFCIQTENVVWKFNLINKFKVMKFA
jgi:hypothetical protein